MTMRDLSYFRQLAQRRKINNEGRRRQRACLVTRAEWRGLVLELNQKGRDPLPDDRALAAAPEPAILFGIEVWPADTYYLRLVDKAAHSLAGLYFRRNATSGV